ncbi:MAG: 16S rRNA (adenine(1518)-N(6)/adenine(1519)-N(6))-dimethyltransferase RsmA [Coprobacillus sp.]|nr:16S rRNA (adenine(1518)-N(6)/adenine(1519)-N(6))-dimethyltransferase RsmA [Coprobacillus sp.]MDY4144771.1 16S rRNA (adenine(1518)-N(6)/adenine(1519)-N(6))-dimethyltransferase RsmA [Bacilli bacterium]CCY07358.1 ribosomal RNA small subunit methyltransferase A [Coprobacillus sp. CAG:698]
MISTKNKTIEILNRNGIFAKKKFGQNFLIDSNIVMKIVKTANITKETNVIEIGPGIGAMTEILAKEAGKVLCFEIDEDMVNILNEEIKNDNVKIVNKDFLKVDLDEEMRYFIEPKNIVVVSNLPYYITTPIIFKLLEYSKNIEKMVFMVQKEVSERLTAKPGSKEYGSLSVLIELNGTMKKEFNVSRNCFYPVPNVDSEIVSMEINKNDSALKNDPIFGKFIQNIFEMKRKTLANNICKKTNFSRDDLNKILQELGLSESVRAESLSLNQISKIYEALVKENIIY